MALQVGEIAPDFELSGVIGEDKITFRLGDYLGKKNVVLAFYPLDWTPVWTAQMPAYNMDLDRFAGYDAQVVGISVDSIYCHVAWQKHETGLLNFPLCSDFYPHAGVAEKYGILRQGRPVPGMNERAIFIVDKKGMIAFAKVYDLGEQPPNEDLFDALEKLNK